MGITAKKIKRAAIYDPYLDTLGGGERYCLTVAEILLKNNCKIDLFWSGDSNVIKKAEERFSLDLKDVNLIPDIFKNKPQKIDLLESKEDIYKYSTQFFYSTNLWEKMKLLFKRYQTTKKYDLIFFLNDGSIPFLFGPKRKFLHVQVPFIQQVSLLQQFSNFIKAKFIDKVVCNSSFTSKFIPNNFKDKTFILYPPVDINKFSSVKNKKNIILSVGRFDNVLNAKKQDVLIQAFQKLLDSCKTKDWKLILAGGSLEDPEHNAYLKYLKEIAKNYPIEFMINPKFADLCDLYSVSSIYWHAAGYDVDENKNPEKTEHFGITIVEAMASGLVPVVINKGGIPEIINDNDNGFLWDSSEELIQKTKELINSPEQRQKMSAAAIEFCQTFSKENFEKQLLMLIN